MMNKKISLKYVLVIIITVVFTWIIHEFTHWLTAKLFGYEASMSLNGMFYAEDENPIEWHKVIVSASGPFVTILQGLMAFLYLKSRGWNKYFYPLLFIAFYMRFLAGMVNFINLNDEGRISEFLGIGTFTIPIIVSGILFYMVYETSKKNKLNWKFQLATTLIVMIASTILIISDQFLGIRIL